jgi:hypothetical protein
MFVIHRSPHPETPACPFTTKVLQTKKHTPIPCPSIIFNFELTIEFIKGFEGASSILRHEH